MKKILPFGNPIVSQNPRDAIVMSILDSHHAYNRLPSSFLDVIAHAFCDENQYYYNSFFNCDVPCIESSQINIHQVTSIVDTLIHNIENDCYTSILLDWKCIAYFEAQAETYYPHLVSVYGVDTNQKTFDIADFTLTGKYVHVKASFHEMERAFQSVVTHYSAYTEYTFPFQEVMIGCKKFISTHPYRTTLDDLKHHIKLFLQGTCTSAFLHYYDIKALPRVANDGSYIEPPVLVKHTGKDVLDGIIWHTKKCLEDKQCIYERKGIYLYFVLTQLLSIQLQTILETQNITSENLSESIKTTIAMTTQLLKETKVLLMIGKKYEVKETKENLITLLHKLEEVKTKFLELLTIILHLH